MLPIKNKIYAFAFIILALGVVCIFFYCVKRYQNPKKINVLFITIDDLRAGQLSCYGYAKKTTPNIDRLAKEGVRFSQAFSNGTWTVQSLPAIFTSSYPHTHGVFYHGDAMNKKLITLAEILKKNGYKTGAINARPVDDISGIKRGFDSYDIIDSDEELNRRAKLWLKEKTNNNFFLWLHYFGVHPPPYSPAPYDKMFLSGRIKKITLDKMKKKFFWKLSYSRQPPRPFSIVNKKEVPVDKFTKDIVEYCSSQYDGALRFVDGQIGGILDYLEELGIRKNTLVIISSDHGEGFGEHGSYFTYGGFYDEGIRIPLLMQKDGFIPKNKEISYQVQAIDIAPTILDFLNIKKSKFMKGYSLKPVMLGTNNYPTPYIFIENINTYNKDGIFATSAIRSKDWKLIVYKKLKSDEGINEMYNLKNDPKELFNLAQIDKFQFEYLKGILDGFVESGSFAQKSHLMGLDEYTKQKLKNFGYLQ